MKSSTKTSLKLFHDASTSVPAYKKFLRSHSVRSDAVKTWGDFQKVPAMSKKNYLSIFPYPDLFRNGSFSGHLVYTATSGSTGVPFYFARNEKLDQQYSVIVQQYLHQSSYGTKGPILVIIAFGMGIWIGGLITYKAFEIASREGDIPVSIITPGINKKEIFSIFKNLAPHYRQVILVGYPPFVKDIIDEATAEGIDLKKFKMRLLFAAESFNEQFRNYVTQKTGIINPYRDTLNIYGSADIGAMAYETPLSILVRELCLNNTGVFHDIFGKISKVPTLAQYDPNHIMFESINGEILLTGNSSIPLIRYAIGDHGGVFSFDEAKTILERNHIDLDREAKRVGIADTIQKLPFVFVYERSDFSIKLYGAIIYPGPVRDAIHEQMFHDFATGKFTMETNLDRNKNEYMEAHIELKRSVKGNKKLAKLLEERIVAHLIQDNAEYHNNYASIPHRVTPRIRFWPHEDPTHFKPGIKQQWVKKK